MFKVIPGLKYYPIVIAYALLPLLYIRILPFSYSFLMNILLLCGYILNGLPGYNAFPSKVPPILLSSIFFIFSVVFSFSHYHDHNFIINSHTHFSLVGFF